MYLYCLLLCTEIENMEWVEQGSTDVDLVWSLDVTIKMT